MSFKPRSADRRTRTVTFFHNGTEFSVDWRFDRDEDDVFPVPVQNLTDLDPAGSHGGDTAFYAAAWKAINEDAAKDPYMHGALV